MKKLTLDEFKKLPHGEVFATGILPNAPDGIFMSRNGGELKWVAKKGIIEDWAIYAHWADNTVEWIKDWGDKVTTEEYIRRCVPCSDKVFDLYRY